MRKNQSKPKACSYCSRAVSNSFVCRRCGRELRELLIGDGWPVRSGIEGRSSSQPGIIWYLHRLRETAYRQARKERALGARASNNGYALLADQRAVRLIARITVTVANWNDVLDRLTARQSDKTGLDGPGRPKWGQDVDTMRIHRIANSIPLLRHNCPDLDRLLHHLLDYAKDAWRIINRPDDICCGPCPAKVRDENGDEIDCARMLYAEEYEDNEGKRMVADTVQCSNPKCRVSHDVRELRERLKQQVHETLFTGPELLKLMETRLNDTLSKSTFYQLVRDGRLRSRTSKIENGAEVLMYTYADVCEARRKSKPKIRQRIT